MQVSVVRKGKVLRTHSHKGDVFVEAPSKGEYAVRICNDSPKRVMAIVSVDGINVINGTDAGYTGPGYVLDPYQSADIPGWKRDGAKVAAFTFAEQGESYAAQTSRGTTHVGLIGVAVFEERVKAYVPPIVIKEEHHHHHHDYTWPWGTPWVKPSNPFVDPYRPVWGGNSGITSTLSTRSMTKSAGSETRGGGEVFGASMNCSLPGESSVADIGTSYGKEVAFHTVSVGFEKATVAPAQVITIRYATREKLKSWGVLVDAPASSPKPSAFPASEGCPAPANWRG